MTSCQNGVWGDEPDGIHDIPCVRVADFDRVGFRVNMGDPTLRSIEPRVMSARRLRSGDLLLEKSGGGERQPVGAVVLYGQDIAAVCSNFVARLAVADGYSPRFLTYLHATLYALRVNTRHIKQSTGIQNLDSTSYLSEATGLPDAKEQRAIAAFLDCETAKIDALVAKKERLIGLLQEERTAIITRAVTKGLDVNAPMKDSGVEWLGEIPAHWECFAIARVTLSRCDGPFGSGLKSEHYAAAGVRVVRLQNIDWSEFSDLDKAFIDETYAKQLGDHSVIAGDLLIAGLGDEGHPVGRACVAPEGIEPAMVKADCFRFRLDQRRILPRFAAYLLSATASATAGALSTGATRSRMNLTATAGRKVAVPPCIEQRAIVELLDRNGESFQALMRRIRGAIDRLKELRTALISAAVTGKIDVREEVE